MRSKKKTVAISMPAQKGPWGGSSPFVTQLASCLKQQGMKVQHRLTSDVDLVVMIDPRDDLDGGGFGVKALRDYKQIFPNTPVIHRINECDKRKGSDFIDKTLAELNQFANMTIFISEWLRDYHAERWFNMNAKHEVIYNGASTRIYHPVGKQVFNGDEPFKIVTHHWSDNWLKGYDIYQQIDSAIAEGELPGVELHIVGRWPKEIEWQRAVLHKPLTGHRLADYLRSCHAYVTGSRWEPCGMHHIEGAQCGLPVLFHKDGGGINEACRQYGITFTADDINDNILVMRNKYDFYVEQVLNNAPSGEIMIHRYLQNINRLLVHSNSVR